jgi:hypothetical protein
VLGKLDENRAHPCRERFEIHIQEFAMLKAVSSLMLATVFVAAPTAARAASGIEGSWRGSGNVIGRNRKCPLPRGL